MVEILRTNDAVRLSWAEALLAESGVESFTMDTHASIMDGSIGAVQRRLMVADEDAPRAKRILKDADPFASED